MLYVKRGINNMKDVIEIIESYCQAILDELATIKELLNNEE